MRLLAFACAALSMAFGATTISAAEHVIDVEGPILSAEDGLLLGNGDLSVSVYQTADQIVWRFGKGDVWDRRLELSENAKPAHIDEIAHGLEVEGWKSSQNLIGAEATRGTDNPKRMLEICQGSSPSELKWPYPCPKPVGELAAHLPPDLAGKKIRQRLTIEEAKLVVECSWASGVKITFESFVPPKTNALVVQWKVDNWNKQTLMGVHPPVWFSLYRWADPPVLAFGAEFYADCRHSAFLPDRWGRAKAAPMAPPTTRRENDFWTIEQIFPADTLFPDGFRYWMTPLVSEGVRVEAIDMQAVQQARLHIRPGDDADHGQFEGQMAVAVATSRDPDGLAEATGRVRAEYLADPAATIARWAEENRQSAAEFWAQSRVSIADPLLENLWYETYHARRCAYRRGAIPPGLFLPSTIRDYSHWHGDYHMNYNFQEPFWGDYAANHLELGDSYFDALAFAMPIGRKIAHDYYGCRGAFIQLSVFPILAQDDPIGAAPLGRMAYMTGWAMHQYWWRYLYTLDRDWLRTTGYPVIRDVALFYTDFLKRRDDGLYHAFPSPQEEEGFTGDPQGSTDRPEVMQHIRYALRTAIAASEALGADDDLRTAWTDRVEHMAGDDSKPPLVLTGIERLCHDVNPPEFGFGRPFRPQPDRFEPRPPPQLGWYFGQDPWAAMRMLHGGEFVAERDLPPFRFMVEGWRRPNGLIGGMAAANYGRCGAWTESLGVAAPVQEMMLQSWDGALRVFPAWPKGLDAKFDSFRAEGAFLVTAAWSQGNVASLSIHSEKGAPCRVYSPWPNGIRVIDAAGREVAVTADTYGRPEFATQADADYRLQPR